MSPIVKSYKISKILSVLCRGFSYSHRIIINCAPLVISINCCDIYKKVILILRQSTMHSKNSATNALRYLVKHSGPLLLVFLPRVWFPPYLFLWLFPASEQEQRLPWKAVTSFWMQEAHLTIFLKIQNEEQAQEAARIHPKSEHPVWLFTIWSYCPQQRSSLSTAKWFFEAMIFLSSCVILETRKHILGRALTSYTGNRQWKPLTGEHVDHTAAEVSDICLI